MMLWMWRIRIAFHIDNSILLLSQVIVGDTNASLRPDSHQRLFPCGRCPGTFNISLVALPLEE